MNTLLKDLAKKYPFPKTKHYKRKKINGWRIWDTQFLDLLEPNHSHIIVEVGCWYGKTTCWLAETFKNSTIICIDTFTDHTEPGAKTQVVEDSKLYNHFITNVWEYKERIIPIPALSWDGLQEIKNHQVMPTLIYIDAAHAYEYVSKDISICLESFPNSIICGDDYDVYRPNGVKLAVDEKVKEGYTLSRFERFWHLQ
jgi:SAM-dependent methyltransferase